MIQKMSPVLSFRLLGIEFVVADDNSSVIQGGLNQKSKKRIVHITALKPEKYSLLFLFDSDRRVHDHSSSRFQFQ